MHNSESVYGKYLLLHLDNHFQWIVRRIPCLFQCFCYDASGLQSHFSNANSISSEYFHLLQLLDMLMLSSGSWPWLCNWDNRIRDSTRSRWSCHELSQCAPVAWGKREGLSFTETDNFFPLASVGGIYKRQQYLSVSCPLWLSYYCSFGQYAKKH
jgi:hypothetical protein